MVWSDLPLEKPNNHSSHSRSIHNLSSLPGTHPPDSVLVPFLDRDMELPVETEAPSTHGHTVVSRRRCPPRRARWRVWHFPDFQIPCDSTDAVWPAQEHRRTCSDRDRRYSYTGRAVFIAAELARPESNHVVSILLSHSCCCVVCYTVSGCGTTYWDLSAEASKVQTQAPLCAAQSLQEATCKIWQSNIDFILYYYLHLLSQNCLLTFS